MKKYSIKSEDGITLVEILLAIAVSSILMTTIGTMFMSSFNGVDHVREFTQTQRNINLVNDIISKELKNSIEIKLLSSLPNPLDSDYYYIYKDGYSVVMANSSSTNSIVNDNIHNLEFDIIENTNTDSKYKYSLQYSINEMSNTLILNNLSEYNSVQNKSIIAYKKPGM